MGAGEGAGTLVIGSAEATAKLWEEKIDSLSSHAGNLERRIGELNVELDTRREAVERIEKETETKNQRLAHLSDKVASGQAAIEEHRHAVMASLEKQEREAQAKINAAAASEDHALKAQQQARQLRAAVDAVKTDAITELTKTKETLAALIDKSVKGLAAIV